MTKDSLWAMRDEILLAARLNDKLLAKYVPPTQDMAMARHLNCDIAVATGGGDDIVQPCEWDSWLKSLLDGTAPELKEIRKC